MIKQIDKARADIDGLVATVGEGQQDLSQQVNAANAARDASQTARDQSQAARDAASSAQVAASDAARGAAVSVSDAKGYAQTASGAANVATQKAGEAGSSASTASANADIAKTQAGQASASAGRAATSEANAAGSSNSAVSTAAVVATTRQSQLDDIARSRPPTLAPGSAESYVLPVNARILGPSDQWPQPYITQTDAGQGAGFEDYVRFRKLMPKVPGRQYRARTYFYTYANNMTFGLGLYGSTSENFNEGNVTFLGWLAGPVKPNNAVGAPSGFILLEGGWDSNITALPFVAVRLVVIPSAAGVTNNGIFHTMGIAITDVTSENASKASADASSGSASSAAASQTAAGQSASAAEASRQAASTAAGTATAARDTAATAKNDAQGAANSAASSSSLAAGASSTAIAAAAAEMPSDFTQNGQFWMTNYTGAWEASKPEASGWTFPMLATKVARSPSWLGGDASTHPSRQFTTRGRMPLIAGRKYRFTFDAGLATYQGGEVSFDMYFLGTAADMVSHVDSFGAQIDYGRFHKVFPAPYARFKWVFECTAEELLGRAPSAAYISPFIRGRGGDGMVLDIYVFKMEDVTSESAAQGYASAASGSASSASASAGAAGNSANAAEQSRINANTANGAAQSAAGAANSSAVAADASRAQAQTQATIASSYGSTSVNVNDKFANWPDPAANPAGWTTWAAQGNYRIARLDGGTGSPYAIQTLNDTANVESGIMQVINGFAGPWVMEATVRLDANTLVGSGLTVHGQWSIDFAREADTNGVISYNGDASQNILRTFSKLFYMTPQFIRDTGGRVNFHCMHSWQNFGQRDPRYMTWFMARLRPATQPEIDAGKALANAAANASRIAQVNDSLSTLYGSLAQRISTTEATAGDLAARTNITETSVADLRTKQAAARLVLGATSPGGNPTITIRSDTANGGAIDFGADTNFVGDLKVQKNKGGNVISIDSDHGFIITAPNGVRVIELTVD